MTKKKYLYTVLAVEGKKTNLYDVRNKSGFTIGIVKWYAPWRQYCFYPGPFDILLNNDCMREITDFLDGLKKQRKEKKDA